MSRWSEAFVAEALGVPLRAGPGYSSITTDTRALQAGSLFVALIGERFDGHTFLEQAAALGATGAVVRRGTMPVKGLTLYQVADTLHAYGDLGRARRRQIRGPVVCVTGNNGKTTTKEMTAAVLRTSYRTWATPRNNNNLVGVPLTILESPDDTEALVIEAGANTPGELPRYREIIEPTITIATNATEGHLEGYGTLQAIIDETVALTASVPLAIVGLEPPSLAEGARRAAGRTVSVGWADADRMPGSITMDALARVTMNLGGASVTLPLPGRHQAINALFAWVAGEECCVDADAARAALAMVTVPGGRSELTQVGGLTILNDCYNANPHSFAAAIATARSMRGARRLVFAAGSMLELGDDADRLHAEVAAELVELNPDVLAAVGAMAVALEPYRTRLGDRLITALDAPALGPLLARRLHGDEIVVLKASRGVALERILSAIVPHPTPNA